MSFKAIITQGHYRNRPVQGEFELVKGYTEGARGGHITVRNPNHLPADPPVQRITVTLADFIIRNEQGEEIPNNTYVGPPKPNNQRPGNTVTSSGTELALYTHYEQEFTSKETDEEALKRIDETFKRLDKLTDGAAAGIIRGMVVSGPPGVGKSYGIERQLDVANMFRTLKGQDPLYEIISGGISSVGLFQKLYHNREKKQVLVFDDCDGVLWEEESLNLLKAALNSGDRRRICWNKESRVLNTEDIPNQFEFAGSVIFISNINFAKAIERGSRISAHLEAIMDRCHYLDLGIGSRRDRMLVIKLRIEQGMLKDFNFTQDQIDSIIKFMEDHADFMRELSPRTAKKIADLVFLDPNDWVETAEDTVLVKEAKFRRLVNEAKENEITEAVESAIEDGRLLA